MSVSLYDLNIASHLQILGGVAFECHARAKAINLFFLHAPADLSDDCDYSITITIP